MSDLPDWFVYEHTVDGLFFKALLVSDFDGHSAMFHISWS